MRVARSRHERENANKCCRGCLTEPASELDLAWSGYVETVERLVVAVGGDADPLGLNVKIAVRELDSRISDAIMHAMEDGPRLEEKVSERPSEEPCRGRFCVLDTSSNRNIGAPTVR